jgi:hypothetical protein
MDNENAQPKADTDDPEDGDLPLEKHIFQTIFLDNSPESSRFWSKGEIDSDRVRWGSYVIVVLSSLAAFAGNSRKMVEAAESQMATLCWNSAVDGLD